MILRKSQGIYKKQKQNLPRTINEFTDRAEFKVNSQYQLYLLYTSNEQLEPQI